MGSRSNTDKAAEVIFLHDVRYQRDPLSAVFEDLPDEELEMLAANIKAEGQKLPITINSANGLVLDGWQRLRACELTGVKPKVDETEISHPAAFVMAVNEHRRGSTAPTVTHRALLATDLLTLEWEARGSKGRKPSAKKVAEAAGCSTATVEQVRRSLRWDAEYGTDYEDLMRRGKLSAAAANDLIVAAEYAARNDSDPRDTHEVSKHDGSEQQAPLKVQVGNRALTEEEWKERLRRRLLSMSPSGFEHFTAELLKSTGSIKVEVTGRSGDGGIDGIATQPGLAQVQIAFQSKRYKDSVGSAAIRDFRGAIDGRCESGLFVTTGNFTRDAREEASRHGAKRIDLVDGQRLCDLLKEREIGVHVRMVEEVTVDDDYFDQFEESQ